MDLYERLESRLNNRIKKNQEEYEKRGEEKEATSNRRAYNSSNSTNLIKSSSVPTRYGYTASDSGKNITYNLPVANDFKGQLETGKRVQPSEDYSFSSFRNKVLPTRDKGVWIAKKFGSGVLSGINGIEQAGITDIANNLKKGKEKSGKEVLNDVSNSMMLNPIQDSVNIGRNLLGSIDPKKSFWENVGSLGTNVASNAFNNLPFKKQFNALNEVVGKILPSNASSSMLSINDALSKPVENLNEKLAKEGEKYGPVTQLIGNTSQVVGNMAPSIGVSVATGNPNMGLLTMAASAKGQATQEALNRGASLDEAVKIGDTKAMVEVATEKLTGGLNVFGKGALDDIITKGIDKKVKNNVLNFLTKKGVDIAGEVVEEAVSDVLGTVVDKGTVDPNASYSLKDFGDTAVTTILSTIVLNAIGGGYTPKAFKENSAKLQNSISKQNGQQKLQEAQHIINNVNNSGQGIVNGVRNLQNGVNNQFDLLSQQINQVQNKMTENGNMGQIKIDSENFARQVDSVKNGTFPKNDMLVVGNTPKVLMDIGLPDLPITMTQKHLDTIMNDSGKYNNANYHDLGIDIVKQLPEAINNPLDIVKSNTKDDSVVLTTYLADKNNNPVIASIKIDGKGKVNDIIIDTNVMTSAYGKSNYDNFMRKNLENDNLLYDIDRGVLKKLSRQGSNYLGLTTSVDTVDNVSTVNDSITSKNRDVNSNYYMHNLQNNVPINRENYKQDDFRSTNASINSNNKVADNGNMGQMNDILNNKDVPMQNYQYVETDNAKINSLRQDMSKYWSDSNKTRALGSVIEKVISDKDYNVRLDDTLKNSNGDFVNARISTLNNGEVEIRINPNAKNVGEFLLMHETTHAIETQEMRDLILDYASKNKSFNEALESLKKTYGTEDVNSEVVADISGQLFGNQEFINNLSMEKPSVFKRIYNKIIELANKITGNSHEALFIRDLKNKWQEAYRTQSNNLDNNTFYSIQQDSNGNKYVRVDTDQDIFDGIAPKDYNKIAKMYMQDYLLGNTKLNNNDNAIIDSRSASKYTNPRQRTSYMSEKMQLTPELKNVLEIAQKESMSLPTKENSKYKSWEYYKFNFELGGKWFDATVNIGIDKNGNKHFYEINKIRLTGISSVSTNSQHKANFINNSILPTNDNVNSTKYSMPESENNTWKEHLDSNFKSNGTTTNLQDIKLPINPKLQKDIKKHAYIRSTNASIKTNDVFPTKSIENSKETVYNNIESESGINGRFNQGNDGTSRLFTESTKTKKEYTWDEYNRWEQSIKPISKENITIKEQQLINKSKSEHNKDVYLFDDNNNDNTYSGGASRITKNKINISRQQAEYFGLELMIDHETMESDILQNVELYKETVKPVIEKIKQDSNFVNQANEFWKNQTANKPSDNLIAKDIFCDRFAQRRGSELKYNNLLSQETNMNIDYAIDNFYKQVYGKELVDASSFNLATNRVTENQASNYTSNTSTKINNVIPIKEYFDNKENSKYLSDEDLSVLNKVYEKEGRTEVLTEKRKAKILEKYVNDKFTFKDSLDVLAQKFVNKGHYVDKLAERTGNLELKYMYDRNLNSFAEGQYVIGVAQTDNSGKSIGKSLNDVWKPVENSNLTNEFNEYLLHKLNIDRAERNKYVFGDEIKPGTSTAISLELEKKHPEFKEWAKDIKNFNHNNMMNLKDAGLITQDTIDYLETMYPNYVPILRDVEDRIFAGNNDKTGTLLPIKSATGGNADIQPVKDAMAAQSIRIKRLINQNKLGQELSKCLKNAKVEDVSDISVTPDVLLAQDSLIETDGQGNKFYSYFEDGVMQRLKINDDLYESLKPSEISKLEKTLPFKAMQKVSNVHRSLLTSSNPLFVVTNFFKDFQDGMFNSKYSSKFIKNYGKALHEIVTKGKYYESYMANGGMTNTYFDYNEGIKKKSNRFVEKIRSANEIVEQLPRLSEFISTLEAGKSLNEALYNSAEITTNFKRGGDIAKMINRNGANFFNASIQGFDKQFRNFTGQNGAKGYINLLLKATVMGVVPAVLNHMLLDDDDDYQELSQSDKDLYYLFKYDDGKFIRIPKGRVLSIFGATARRSIESVQGQDDAWDGFFSTVKNQVAPNNPFESNIFSPIASVASNKTWYGSDLVSSRLAKELPKNQFDEKTDEFSKWLGEKLNLSPKKINYLIDQYSGGIGDFLLPAITPEAKQNVVIDKFTVDSELKNKNVSKFYNVVDKQTQIANDSFATDEDLLQSKYLSTQSKEIGKLYKEKRDVQMSNISQNEKREKVRLIQSKINDLCENALNNYKDIKVDGITAKGKDTSYYKDGSGEWVELSNKEKEANKDISIKTYADYKNRVYKMKQQKVSNGELSKKQDLKDKDKIQVLLNSNYSNKEISALYENYILSSSNKTYFIIKQSGMNVKEYLRYEQQSFSSDKKDDGTINGKTVSNSKKLKEYTYVNNMNVTYEQRLVLLGLKYNLSSSEKATLASFVNDFNDTKDNKMKIFSKLKGFTVYKDGRIKF